MRRSLSEFEPLKPAETSLLKNSKSGTLAVISESRPENQNLDNTIRAEFLRFIALGGDEHNYIHEKGLFLKGAWIEGDVDFVGTNLPQSLGLINCHIGEVNLRYCQIKGFLGLQGCFVESIDGDSLRCSGDIFLNEGFISSGTVRFCDAQINGCLDCKNATFFGNFNNQGNTEVLSLACENASIGNVFLNNEFSAHGTVNLAGVQIRGNLICDGGKFNSMFGVALNCRSAAVKGNIELTNGLEAHGQVCLSGSKIGNLKLDRINLESLMDKYAFRAESMEVNGIFSISRLNIKKGYVSLMGSRAALLEDDLDSWPKGSLLLDGFVYTKFAGSAPTSAEHRLIWLHKQIPDHLGTSNKGKDFRPQPWRQLQKVLLEMGHNEDMKKIGISFEKHRRKEKLISCNSNWLYKKIITIFHWLYGFLIDYGYRPLRLLAISICVWIFCGGCYFYSAYHDVFAPSNPSIFQNADYDVCKSDNKKAIFELEKTELSRTSCVEPPPVQGAGNWYLCSKLRAEYTTFSPFAYSLDVILPFVDLQQESDWAPMTPTPDTLPMREFFSFDEKHGIRFLIWVEILYGWIASLLMVAVVSGSIKNKMD